ncbi:leucine-rich repeat domain-containing protein [Flavobacterium quisquiliarum]|uniref:Leucine-rich repeat domain-containing protein n=1 Tax=Flavobacterium quisquiliarum TaxID=1834436 RepID=A0ABV8WCS6_9FLAO|nr:leucine-rich repeat domain-containing protein [Flavobacterium quisquiliarum]MBW1656760.1 hypothetical protein [Flavobacterium quisquiliarum]NWL00386.1 hypothetical protein [Flavobacterium collinsii]
MVKNIFTAQKKANKVLTRIIIFSVLIVISNISYSCLKKNAPPPVYAEIPDVNFKAYLKTIVPLAFTPDGKFISNHPSVTSYNEIMSIRKKNITSLSGIEHFVSLTKLDCLDNHIAVLDISKNKALTNLYCSYNQLTNLDVSKNTNLIKLDCSNNQIKTLDVSKNSNLVELICCCNLITTLKFGENEILRKIYCPYNQLTVLDVTKNKALIELNCKDNPRNTVVIVNPYKLSRLYIDSFTKCNHPSIKAFKDRGGELYGTYSEVINEFICQ